MRKITNKIGFLFLLFILFIGINKTTVMAAGTSLGGTTSATIGDTVSITVNVTGDSSLYNTEIGVNYDSSVLEFVLSDQNTENGGGGTVRIVKTGSGNSISHTLKFKAIAAGTASISVGEAKVVYTSLEEVNLSGSSMSVAVSAPQTASANNSLSSLQISPGTLSPAFSSKTLNYSATVDNSVTKISVSATPQDKGAGVTSLSGNDNLSVGSNTIKIQVTAENNDIATYTIKVTRQAATETTQEEEVVEEDPKETEEENPEETEKEEISLDVTIGNQTLYIYNDFKDEKIPEGFEKSTSTYNSQEINVVKNSAENLVLVYLVDENDENGAFYIYDEVTGSFSEFVEVVGATNRYFIVNPDSAVSIPTGYIETTIELDGKTVQAWYLETDGTSGFYLVYAVNWEGQKGFYQYDSVEGTFQRFVDTGETVAASVTTEDENGDVVSGLEEKLNELQEKYDKDMSTRLKIISILAIITFLAVICVINLLFKVRNIMNDQREVAEGYLDEMYLDEEENSSLLSEEDTEEKSNIPKENVKENGIRSEVEKQSMLSGDDDDDFDFIDLDDDDE